MLYDTPLISTIAAGLVLAFVLGAIASRLRLPALVGYLVAGIVVGPFTPGIAGDAGVATTLAEIGVVLLMFGIGLRFSLKDLMSVPLVAIPGALFHLAGGTLMGLALALLIGWPIGAGLVLGLAFAAPSAFALIKAFEARRWVESDRGRLALGWVLVESVAVIVALVLIPAIAGLSGITRASGSDPFISFVERLLGTQIGVAGVVAVTALKLAAFAGFMFVIGRQLVPLVLSVTVHAGNREVSRLAVLAIALAVALGAAYLFGVSLAIGAFLAGMILAESALSQRAAEESLPLRDAFAVLFFLGLGMLFNPAVLWTQPVAVIVALIIILFGKTLVALLTAILFGRPAAMALTVAASLAQIGEFSFVVASLGLALGLMPVEGREVVIAGAVLSILVNPLLIWVAERLRPSVEARIGRRGDLATQRVEPFLGGAPTPAREPASAEEGGVHATALTGHTIVVGYGQIGSLVVEGLKQAGQPFLVIEDAEDRINAARAAGCEVIAGNAVAVRALQLANIEGATTVIVAIPNTFEAGQAIARCRKANANALIVARAQSDEEEQYLKQRGANVAITGEREIAAAMVGLVNPETIASAARSTHDAIEAAIVPKGSPSFRTLPREPERTLTDIDEDELARAIGAPLPSAAPPAPVAPPPAPPPTPRPPPGEAMSIEETDAIDVVPAPPPVEPTDVEHTEPEPPAAPSADVLPFKLRQPASRAGTPFEPPGKPEKPGDDSAS